MHVGESMALKHLDRMTGPALAMTAFKRPA
jgi:hypothetical protein